jgi:hypothetical protein
MIEQHHRVHLQRLGASVVLLIISAFFFSQVFSSRFSLNWTWVNEVSNEVESVQSQGDVQEGQTRLLPPPELMKAVKHEQYSWGSFFSILCTEVHQVKTCFSSKKAFVETLYVLFHSWKHFLV